MLGEGATGSVYETVKNGQRAAIKILEKQQAGRNYARLRRNMEIETNALSKVNGHPYILKIVGFNYDVTYEKDG